MQIDAQILTFILNIIIVLVGAVWAVGKIQTATALLGQSIDELSKYVGKLESKNEEIAKKLDAHSGKIIRLEEKVETLGTIR